jgi:hypothetical protein
MADKKVIDLVKQSSVSFTGTIVQLGASMMTDIPVNQNTAIVRVDDVLHAPDSLRNLSGSHVTVQLRPRAAKMAVGDSATFFTNPVAFGDTLAVEEVGRLSVADVAESAIATAAVGLTPMMSLRASIESDRLRDHARSASAVVSARVTRLAKAAGSGVSEHDPDWWVATLAVNHTEIGDVPAGRTVKVLYANSRDVMWRNRPKPKAGQEGVWILHPADPSLQGLAMYVLDDPDDYQPVQFLDSLRPQG